MTSDWLVEHHRGSAAWLHEASAGTVVGDTVAGDTVAGDTVAGDTVAGDTVARGTAPRDPDETDGVRRRIRVLEATGPALVLGRAQPEEHVDPVRAAAAGVAVARRRSGGGAVLVDPDGIVWIDVVVPATDPLWSADVARAMWWVGEAWTAALAAVGVPDAGVWRGSMLRTEWSDRVCFAGVGPGEVVLPGPAGRPTKIVGVAQRRTREGALFQCAALVEWDPAAVLDLLALSSCRRRAGVDDLAAVAIGVGARAAALVEAVVATVGASGRARAGPRLP